MLSVKNLFFDYPKRPLFKNLSLSLATEEVVVLLGPSGTGKTTLLRLILGMLKPQSGQIEVQGKMAYMGQEDLLLPWYTLEENLKLFAAMAKVDPEPIGSWLERFGLAGCEGCFPHELSKGMRQRGALIRALLLNRPFLLLDEPFSSLDAKIKEELLQLLLALKKEKQLTILMITHDFNDALAIADRVVLLKDYALPLQWVVHEHDPVTLKCELRTNL